MNSGPQGRKQRHGRVSVTISLRVNPTDRLRLDRESVERRLSRSALVSVIVETMNRDNLFEAVLGD